MRFALTLCWILWVLTARPMVAIHENVVGFDTRIFEELLGKAFGIAHIVSRPSCMGYRFLARKRLFTVVWLKAHVLQICDMVQLYDRVSRDVRRQQPEAALSSIHTTDKQVLLTEENVWRSKKRMPPLTEPSSDWHYLLGKQDASFLKKFLEMWTAKRDTDPHTDKNCLFNLSQNPAKRFCCTSAQGMMPTLTCSSRKMWSPYLRRWLVSQELSVAMGFVVGARDSGTPVDLLGDAPTCAKLGNAMHVACIGSVIGCALASLHPC